jgi:catechol 2,3-dioxygenase-like lactoylglutathione lyase family enzyme
MKNLKWIASAAFMLTACSPSPDAEVVEDTIITGVNYIGASVSNLEQTADLYSEAIDLKVIDNTTISNNSHFDKIAGRSGVTAQTKMMRSANAQVRFMTFTDPSDKARATSPTGVQGPGIAHVCYQVDHQTQAYHKFLTGGAKHIGDKEMVHLNPKNL